MLVCATLIYLCSSCGCEVVLTMLKFISYISCILYASISTCRENSVKSSNICVLGIHENLYAHIKGEFMDFLWRSFVFGFRLPLLFVCVLHELYLRLVFGFEHLVCNV